MGTQILLNENNEYIELQEFNDFLSKEELHLNSYDYRDYRNLFADKTTGKPYESKIEVIKQKTS